MFTNRPQIWDDREESRHEKVSQGHNAVTSTTDHSRHTQSSCKSKSTGYLCSSKRLHEKPDVLVVQSPSSKKENDMLQRLAYLQAFEAAHGNHGSEEAMRKTGQRDDRLTITSDPDNLRRTSVADYRRCSWKSAECSLPLDPAETFMSISSSICNKDEALSKEVSSKTPDLALIHFLLQSGGTCTAECLDVLIRHGNVSILESLCHRGLSRSFSGPQVTGNLNFVARRLPNLPRSALQDICARILLRNMRGLQRFQETFFPDGNFQIVHAFLERKLQTERLLQLFATLRVRLPQRANADISLSLIRYCDTGDFRRLWSRWTTMWTDEAWNGLTSILSRVAGILFEHDTEKASKLCFVIDQYPISRSGVCLPMNLLETHLRQCSRIYSENILWPTETFDSLLKRCESGGLAYDSCLNTTCMNQQVYHLDQLLKRKPSLYPTGRLLRAAIIYRRRSSLDVLGKHGVSRRAIRDVASRVPPQSVENLKKLYQRQVAWESSPCAVCFERPNDPKDVHAALTKPCLGVHNWTSSIICSECLQQHIESNIYPFGKDLGKHATIEPKCWAPNCSALLNHHEVQRYVSEELFQQYDSALCDQAIENMAHIVVCTTKNCRGRSWFEIEPQVVNTIPTNAIEGPSSSRYEGAISHNIRLQIPSEFETLFKCPICNQTTCLQCHKNVNTHTSYLTDNDLVDIDTSLLKCPATLSSRERSQLEAHSEANKLSEAEIQKIAKTCAKCGARIQKIEGCDHMTCLRCKYEFCYVCGVSYVQINAVGNSTHELSCPHYRDPGEQRTDRDFRRGVEAERRRHVRMY